MLLRKPLCLFRFFVINFKAPHIFSRNFFSSLSRSSDKLNCSSVCGSLLLAANYIKCKSYEKELDPESTINDSTSMSLKSNIEEPCIQYVKVISNLIDEISVKISDFTNQYKNCLNELMILMEKLLSLEEYSVQREEFEEALIITRAKVIDSRKEFLEAFTLIDNMREVLFAVSKFASLIGSESSINSLTEASQSLLSLMENEMQDVRMLEQKCLQVEKNLIINTKS